MDILIFAILTNFLYYCCGGLVVSTQKSDFHSQFFIYLTGVISVSFIALFLNFFTKLSMPINTATYVLIIIAFLIKNKFVFNEEKIKFLLISSAITFLLIVYSNVNRPDAGLYHLPYISLINESKIIFGANNIHFRFGHVSIMQYVSAINYNFLFLENGISIPLASIVSFFYIYFFYDIWKVIKKKRYPDISSFFSLFILIYVSFKITRYSSFGNDAVAHLLFFYLVSYILKNSLKKINFNYILLISVFAFANKSMLGIIFTIPTIIFFYKYGVNFRKIFLKFISVPSILLYLWLIKNIIISGCLVFPVKLTCIESLPWSNPSSIQDQSISGAVWSKGWPDRENKSISMQEYNKNFAWLETWSKTHLKYILNIIIPYALILLIIVIYISFKSKKSTKFLDSDFKIRFIIATSTSLVGSLAFLIYFPVYRYGYSYLITSLCLLFVLIIRNKILLEKKISVFKTFFFICVIAIISKQVQKIYKNTENNLWPNIYSYQKEISEVKKIKIGYDFYYYYPTQNDNLCMYRKSVPCTNYIIEQKINHKNKYSYTFLSVK